MKVIILSAGMGKRFRRINLPKSLTLLSSGESILDLQIRTLSQFISPHQIIIVSGYRKEKLIESHPDLLYVYSPNYERENTSKSLLRAIYKLDNEDLLWVNGDVIFHPEALKALLSNRTKNSMVVNIASVGDEEVKYRTNSKGRILEVSKTVKEAQGEALGINFFQASDLESLKMNLERCQDDAYFEKAVEMCIEEGIPVWAVPVNPLHCTEIDFPEDLDRANQLMQQW